MNTTYHRVKWRRYLYYPAMVAAGLLLVLQTRTFFSYTGWRWLYILSLSATLSFCLTPICSRIARKFGIVDVPDSRKVHLEATPLLGGGAVFIAFIASLVINGIYSVELVSILVSALIIFCIGLIDDVMDVPAALKLAVQLLCTIVVIRYGVILTIVPETYGAFSSVGNVILTAVWIIGITNAMNFFDGMDGLAAGMGAIIAFFLGVVAFQTFQPFIGWVAVAVIGSCVGFLPYNFRLKGNASIFLGDAGSTTMGFILACVAVYGDWNTENWAAAIISPLLIFWVLIFDMTYITIDRIATGRVNTFRQWIDYVGRDHLHHRLEEVLGGKKKSVLMIYLINICLGTSAVVLRNARSIDAVLLVFQAIIVVIIITILERRGRALIKITSNSERLE